MSVVCSVDGHHYHDVPSTLVCACSLGVVELGFPGIFSNVVNSAENCQSVDMSAAKYAAFPRN